MYNRVSPFSAQMYIVDICVSRRKTFDIRPRYVPHQHYYVEIFDFLRHILFVLPEILLEKQLLFFGGVMVLYAQQIIEYIAHARKLVVYQVYSLFIFRNQAVAQRYVIVA